MYEALATDWLRTVDPRTLATSVIEHDRWDQMDWDEINEAMGLLATKAGELAEENPNGPEMLADTFYSLIKADPARPEREAVRPSHVVNWSVAGEMMDLPVWHRLRRETTGDEFSAGMAATVIADHLKTLYRKSADAQEQADALEAKMAELNDAQAEQTSLEELLDRLDADDPQRPEAAEAKEQGEAQVEALAQETAEAADRLQRLVNAAGPEQRMTMGEALEAAAEEVERANGAARAWGHEPGELQHMNPSERLALGKRLAQNPKIAAVSDIFGRMKEFMLGQQQIKVNYVREEIYDITFGNDLAHVLPSELARLVDPDQQLFFLNDFIEGKLMQYELRGTEKKGKGGICLGQDQSTSMKGDRDVWATAFGLCLMHLAKIQHRSFHVILFAAKGQMKQFSFAGPADFNTERMLEWAETFLSGGTDFEGPLDAAKAHLAKEFVADGAVEGDIVLVTDGECDTGETWFTAFKAEQKRLGFCVYGVQIGSTLHHYERGLPAVSDNRVSNIRDLVSGEDVSAVFRGI